MKAINRIYEYIESKSISINEFSLSIGVSNGYLAKQKAANANIGSHIIEKIVINFPEINTDWLMTGNGEMLKPQRESFPQNIEIPAHRAPEGIPLIPLDAMAGYMAGNFTQIMDYDCDHYVIPNLKADFLINVKGDSMMPKYFPGDIVACKQLYTSSLFFQWNKVYVIGSEQGVLLKRVKKSNAENSILLVSDNSAYDPFDISLEEVQSLAIVVGLIRLE